MRLPLSRRLLRPLSAANVSELGNVCQRVRPCARTRRASTTRTWATVLIVKAKPTCEIRGWPLLSATIAFTVRLSAETLAVGGMLSRVVAPGGGGSPAAGGATAALG